MNKQEDRWALVTGRGISIRQVAAYLPDNYSTAGMDGDNVIIRGTDNAGWTLDDYVIPRLLSGLMGAKEVFPGDGEWNEDFLSSKRGSA